MTNWKKSIYLVSMSTAPLEAQYTAWSFSAAWLAWDDILTMLPATFLCIIFSATICETFNICLTLTSKVRSKSSLVACKNGLRQATPALFTRRSMGRMLWIASLVASQSRKFTQRDWIFESCLVRVSRYSFVFERAITVPPNFDRRRARSLPIPIEIFNLIKVIKLEKALFDYWVSRWNSLYVQTCDNLLHGHL